MSFVSIIIIALLVLLALLIFRRLFRKNDKQRSNRYRDYQVSNPKNEKPVKAKKNRYREKEKKVKVEKPPKEKVTKEQKLSQQKLIEIAMSSDDPDVVLGLKESPTPDREKPIPTAAQITLKPPPPPPPLITFHVMAEPDKEYSGYELLQVILSVGMRFGHHQIFHRHQTETGTGSILFSLSSAVSPGTFDLQQMGSFSTPGLSLFFTADQVDDPIEVYELMLQVAGQFVEDLGGQVLDDRRQLLTASKVVEQRQMLRHYMEGQQVPDLFEQIVEE